MAYYTALIAAWNGATQPPAGVTGTALTGLSTAAKIAAINGWTVAGPNVDVPVSAIVGSLMLGGAYLPLSVFVAGATNGNTTHDSALSAAKMLMAWITVPNAPAAQMSNPTVFAEISGMASAVLVQETATPGSTGFTQAVHDALIALSATTKPWWQANNYSSPIGTGDLSAAGGLT